MSGCCCVHCGWTSHGGPVKNDDLPGCCENCWQITSRKERAITCIRVRTERGELTTDALDMAYGPGGVLHEN